MKSDGPLVSYLSFGLLAVIFTLGFMVLLVRLRTEQIDRAAEHRLAMERQSFRRVQTAGLRGRILARNGEPLAENRLVLSLEAYPETFRPRRRGERLADNLDRAIARMTELLGRPPTTSTNAIAQHLRIALAQPLTLWRDLSEEELARFSEAQSEHPGFECEAESERVYPQGSLAAHVIGYVGRADVQAVTGNLKVNYAEKEMFGREGLELRYDEFLRSTPGEDRIVVDVRGYATERRTLVEPCNGCDLRLTLDLALQQAVERELAGCRGACVVLDPRDGAVLAMASAPTFDPGMTVPYFPAAVYGALANDPGKPLLRRATAGLYAPGSTFKPLTALAALEAGWAAEREVCCEGAYLLGRHPIRCARRYGHGDLDLVHALRDSCNPYFCTIGMETGDRRLSEMARRFGLGSRTEIDFPGEAEGLVPDAEWKRENRREPWVPGDLAQMSIGQGMLLVTPLQMARVVAALGSGRLVTPHLDLTLGGKSRPVPVDPAALATVREGMRLVVNDPIGTGRRAGAGVKADVLGKTGTAEVGAGETRRKNTWFIAYATPNGESRAQTPLALAMVIENGESGGGTTAPKVANVLRAFYNPPEEVQ